MLNRTIYYWHGANTSIITRGSTTYNVKVLHEANNFGNTTHQYRENQGSESNAFKNLFHDQIKYITGSPQSANRVVLESDSKMYIIKGDKNIYIKRIRPSSSRLNNGDCFIYDTGYNVTSCRTCHELFKPRGVIYVFNGADSNSKEQFHSYNAAEFIFTKDRNARSTKIVHIGKKYFIIHIQFKI